MIRKGTSFTWVVPKIVFGLLGSMHPPLLSSELHWGRLTWNLKTATGLVFGTLSSQGPCQAQFQVKFRCSSFWFDSTHRWPAGPRADRAQDLRGGRHLGAGATRWTRVWTRVRRVEGGKGRHAWSPRGHRKDSGSPMVLKLLPGVYG